MSKPRYNRIVNLNESEDQEVSRLQAQGIAVNEIFRRGLQLFRPANADGVRKPKTVSHKAIDIIHNKC